MSTNEPPFDSKRLMQSRWPKQVGRDTVDLTALPDTVEGDDPPIDCEKEANA
jgi:hypothetical protein